MAKFPSLPIFTDALLGDTQHLTQAEFGAYMLMLIVAWRTPGCCLPNDDLYLCRISRSTKNWHRIKRAVMPFWHLGEDEQWRQKRLTYEHLRAAEIVSIASAAGKSSALKRKERLSTAVDDTLAARTNGTSTPTTTTTKNPPTPYPSPRVIHTPVESEPKSLAGALSPTLERIRAWSEDTSLEQDARARSDSLPVSSPSLASRSSANGANATSAAARALAAQALAEHLPGSDGERWATLLAADTPEDPNHEAAVELCLKAAFEHGIAWAPPEAEAGESVGEQGVRRG